MACARSHGLIRCLNDDEEKEFADADESVILELSRCELKRSVWESEIKVQFPTGTTVGDIETKVFMEIGKCNPPVRALFLSLAIAFDASFDETIDVDRLIALLQSYRRDDNTSEGLTVENNGRTYSSCKRFMECCANQLGLPKSEPTVFWITEVRTDHAKALLTNTDDDLRRRTYGLLTLDEGWRYVPQARVCGLVARHWSSRNFLWVGAFGTGFVIYNGKSPQYSRHASAFFRDWFAVERPYYSDIFHIAGLDHGVLFALEAVTELKLTAESIIKDMEGLIKRQGSGLTTIQASWREPFLGELGSMRLRAFTYLDHVRGIGIGELGTLDTLIANEMGLPAMINDVARFGEMIDGQSMNLATIRLNAIVIALTFVTVLIALIAFFK